INIGTQGRIGTAAGNCKTTTLKLGGYVITPVGMARHKHSQKSGHTNRKFFVDPGDDVLATYPTYSLYEILCQLHGCPLKYVDLDEDFQLTEEFYTTPARLCLLTRPNAPSGVAVPREAVERLCTEFDGIVVIDEAYVDFADDSCIDFPKRFDNVIVMRTFSKSFSLAGMRIGTAVANPDIMAEFMKTKDSYNMDAISQLVGLVAMDDYAHMEMNAGYVCVTRERVRQELIALGFDVPDSQTNFVLARWNGSPSAKELFERLGEQGILVRYFNARRLENALRITIGTDEECDTLLAALRGMVG
ncbi:MAG: aminotransferase class I/II-fold pyridoxal phosphate-dependent enzyme, partial [Candidatus Hydrogenedentes bacterium]|nr:aminotransferase class I/II-fold pyridoxal phosphate-dependent enzyme [Candidatus Hydrogenedentota bacterium]